MPWGIVSTHTKPFLTGKQNWQHLHIQVEAPYRFPPQAPHARKHSLHQTAVIPSQNSQQEIILLELYSSLQQEQKSPSNLSHRFV